MFFSLALLILLSFLPGAAQAGSRTSFPVSQYHLEVSFDIPNHKIMGVAKIQGIPGRKLVIHTGDLKVRSIKGAPHSHNLERLEDPLELESPTGTVEILYEGSFADPEENIIEERGIILRGIWYPLVEGLSRFKLTTTLPKGYVAVSEADRIQKTEKNSQTIYTFDFPYPLNDIDGITFAASNHFAVSQKTYRDIEISIYLLPEDADLAEIYLEHAIRYLKIFENRLGPYPYRRLAIVESFQPGGYSMPTYVLLSQGEIREIKKAEMERTALGHEILHQWFGNSVFTNHDRGNWNEGATIYFADHFYCEQKGSDWRCRRRIFSGFKSHVKARNEFPLRLFSERSDFSSRSIGYGKSAMVFHMLRREVGDEDFFAVIKEFVKENSFRVASWDDLRKSFEKRSKENLAWFFRQWVDGTGVPDLRVEKVKVRPLGNKFEVTFDLAQIGKTFRLLAPITFYFSESAQKHRVALKKSREKFTFILDSPPKELVIDEDYDVFRYLTAAENPPVFERLATGKNQVVLPPNGDATYRRILKTLEQEGVSVKIADSPRDPEADGDTSLIIFGRDHPLIESMLGNIDLPGEGFSVTIRKDPQRPARLVAVIHCAPGEKWDAALKDVLHYPFYSNYLFQNGQRINRTQEETERGIRIKLAKPEMK